MNSFVVQSHVGAPVVLACGSKVIARTRGHNSL